MRKKMMMSLVLTGAMTAAALPVYAGEAASGETVVLYTNDVHCAVSSDEENGVLGYAKVAGLKAALEAEGKEVILVDAGDAIQGAAVGTLSDGEFITDIMNAVGYDLAVPGNHEFDYGMEQFFAITEKAEFPYVSCNFTDLKEDKPVFDAYEIVEAGDKKIAFLGICTPKTITSSTPKYFQDENGEYIYGFKQGGDGADLYESVQTAADAARDEGADYVIAVAHLGIDASTSPWTSSEVIENTTGIDAVLDGHSHSTIDGEKVKNKDGQEVLLTSTGTKLAAVGELTIAEDGTLSSALVTEAEADADAEAKVAEITSELDGVLSEVVAKTEVPLVINDPETLEQEEPVRIIRTAETNLGDLCADAYRAVSGADIAVVNGGGIRADIKAGDITYNDIISVHPFGNELCMVETTGQQILDCLEMACKDVPNEYGGFLQVSGLTYQFDPEIPSTVTVDENGMFVSVDGERRVSEVKVGGEDLDPAKTYTLASHNYLLKNGGDGMNMFMNDKLLLEDIMLDNQVLITYITEHLDGVVGEDYKEPYGSERIVAVQAAEE